MNFYSARISKRIGDLLLGVVAIGILVVSVEHVQILVDPTYRTYLTDSCIVGECGALWRHFFNRLALVFLVIGFSAYAFIGYAAYWWQGEPAKQAGRRDEPFSAGRAIVMYLLDILQVSIAAWMFASLLIGKLTSLPDPAKRSLDELIVLGPSLLITLFSLAACWHLVVFAWYLLSPVEESDRDLWVHSSFALAHLVPVLSLGVVFAVSSYGEWRPALQETVKWSATAYFLVVVALLYATQGRRYLARQQALYKAAAQPQADRGSDEAAAAMNEDTGERG